MKISRLLVRFLMLAVSALAQSPSDTQGFTLFLTPQCILLTATLDLRNEDQILSLRARFDRDGNGILDQEEGKALQSELIIALNQSFELLVDGHPQRFLMTHVNTTGTEAGSLSRVAPIRISGLFECPFFLKGESKVEFRRRTPSSAQAIPLLVKFRDLRSGIYNKGRLGAYTEGKAFIRTIEGIFLKSGETFLLYVKPSLNSTVPAGHP